MDSFIEGALKRIRREAAPGTLSVIALHTWARGLIRPDRRAMAGLRWFSPPSQSPIWVAYPATSDPAGQRVIFASKSGDLEGFSIDGLAIIEPDTIEADIAARLRPAKPCPAKARASMRRALRHALEALG